MCPAAEWIGQYADLETPEWRPLIRLLGEVIVEYFMWMHALDPGDGSRVHAYKHSATRRYLYLSEAGGAFRYAGDGRYRAVSREAAIAAAFERWDEFIHEADEHAVVRDELERALNRARLVDDDRG